jgi:hypothetical protein
MANSPKKRKTPAPAMAVAAAKRPAVANPCAKNNTDCRLATLAEEQEGTSVIVPQPPTTTMQSWGKQEAQLTVIILRSVLLQFFASLEVYLPKQLR